MGYVILLWHSLSLTYNYFRHYATDCMPSFNPAWLKAMLHSLVARRWSGLRLNDSFDVKLEIAG